MARQKLSQAGLARQLGITPAMITRLKARGMPVHTVAAATAWRAEHLDQDRAKPAPAVPVRQPIAAPVNPRILAARLERAEALAKISRLQAGELEGQLCRRDVFVRSLRNIAVDVLQAYGNVQTRLDPLLTPELRRALRDELRAAQAAVYASMMGRAGVSKDAAAGDG